MFGVAYIYIYIYIYIYMYVIMKTNENNVPYHSGFVATNALGHMIYISLTITSCPI